VEKELKDSLRTLAVCTAIAAVVLFGGLKLTRSIVNEARQANAERFPDPEGVTHQWAGCEATELDEGIWLFECSGKEFADVLSQFKRWCAHQSPPRQVTAFAEHAQDTIVSTEFR
jgi:hypothetical protein